MTISREVQRQFFAHDGEFNQVIRLPPAAVASPVGPNRRVGKPWTMEEHERFLEGLQMHPQGPWRRIATHVGTRTSRQTMTHAQKYRERISRLLVSTHSLNASPSSSPPRSPPSQTVRSTPYTQAPSERYQRQSVRCATSPLFDELEPEILSYLLEDGVEASDDSSSSTSSGNQDDVFGDLLTNFGDGQDMLLHLSGLDIGDHSMPIGA